LKPEKAEEENPAPEDADADEARTKKGVVVYSGVTPRKKDAWKPFPNASMFMCAAMTVFGD